MAAPNHVPSKHGHSKFYESPPRRDDSWRAERPGDLPTGLPESAGLGRQGPDQGYALKLVKQFEDEVHLTAGERWEDAAAGSVLVGLKRASLYGRAPVRHDLEIAFRIWGFLDAKADAELVDLRKSLFERVDNPHHYLEARRITDAVPTSSLKALPAAVKAEHERNWKVLLDLDILVGDRHGADEPEPTEA